VRFVGLHYITMRVTENLKKRTIILS